MNDTIPINFYFIICGKRKIITTISRFKLLQVKVMFSFLWMKITSGIAFYTNDSLIVYERFSAYPPISVFLHFEKTEIRFLTAEWIVFAVVLRTLKQNMIFVCFLNVSEPLTVLTQIKSSPAKSQKPIKKIKKIFKIEYPIKNRP